MKIITERGLIQSVLERWERQYGDGCPATSYNEIQDIILRNRKTAVQVRDELRLTDLNTATAERLSAIIGNTSWTTQRCEECQSFASYGVVVGDNSTFLCMDCMGVIADRWCVLKELRGMQ